jgi:hypothetical protein
MRPPHFSSDRAICSLAVASALEKVCMRTAKGVSAGAHACSAGGCRHSTECARCVHAEACAEGGGTCSVRDRLASSGPRMATRPAMVVGSVSRISLRATSPFQHMPTYFMHARCLDFYFL